MSEASEANLRNDLREHVFQDRLRHRVSDGPPHLRVGQVALLDHLGVHALQTQHLLDLHLTTMAHEPVPALGAPGSGQAGAHVQHDMGPRRGDVDGSVDAIRVLAHAGQLRPRLKHVLALVGPTREVLDLVLGPLVKKVLEVHRLARSRPDELTVLGLEPDDVDPGSVLGVQAENTSDPSHILSTGVLKSETDTSEVF